MLAIIEQGKVGQRVVLKRINASLSREPAVLFRLNSSYLNDDQYTRIPTKPPALGRTLT